MGKPAQDLAARQPKESNLSLNIWYKQRRSAVPTQAFVVPKTPWPGWQRTPTRNLRFLATSLIPIAKLVRLFSIVAQCTSFILDLTGPNPSHQVTSTPPRRKFRPPKMATTRRKIAIDVMFPPLAVTTKTEIKPRRGRSRRRRKGRSSGKSNATSLDLCGSSIRIKMPLSSASIA